MLSLVGCGSKHKHTSKWCFDETHHWQEYTCGHTPEDDKKSEHTYSGIQCTVCGRYLPPENSRVEIGDLAYYWNPEVNGYSVYVNSFVENKAHIQIENEIQGYPVTDIQPNGFAYCRELESITIPDNVAYIGNSAFYQCEKLSSVELGKGVTSIGSYAFDSCYSLTDINIPDSIESIGGSAFGYCDMLPYQTYDNAKYLGNKDNPYVVLLEGGKDVKSCTVHENTKIIYIRAFSYNTALESITIPKGVREIGESAFLECSSLTSITIPNGVKQIASNLFFNCSKLTSIKIPNGVTSIGLGAFTGCGALTSVTIPDSVTQIGSNAFDDCRSLEKIVIPSSVTHIDIFAFYHCPSLTIYCEAEKKPDGWDSLWNIDECPVVWGYKGA
ncbi:MAG: leucine-rich repeat domain-containing protein [Clostridia bacterium]|nr:leucine-rich repeat domain-containing protein [Clostridia bacterium]